jgi:hypothetical protein
MHRAFAFCLQNFFKRHPLLLHIFFYLWLPFEKYVPMRERNWLKKAFQTTPFPEPESNAIAPFPVGAGSCLWIKKAVSAGLSYLFLP